MFGAVKIGKGGLQEAARQLLASLLEKKLADAVMVPRATSSSNAQVQTLVTDPDALKGSFPVSPVMAVNSAKLVSDITRLSRVP